MKTLRFAFSIIVLALLAAGYIGSQVYYFSADDSGRSRAPEWAAKIDNPSVVLLALIVLLGAIALWMFPESEGKP